MLFGHRPAAVDSALPPRASFRPLTASAAVSACPARPGDPKMFTARAALPAQLKKDPAPVPSLAFPALPKPLRRALVGLHARLRPRHKQRPPFFRAALAVVCVLAAALSFSLLCDSLRRGAYGPSRAAPARSAAGPLSPAQFSSLLHRLDDANASSARLSDPALIAAARRHWALPATPRRGLAWDAIADDVAIAIKTGHEVAAQRLRVLRGAGWLSLGRRVPNLLVVSDDDDPAAGVIGLKRYALDLFAGRLPNSTRSPGPPPKHWFERMGWLGDKDKNLPALHLLRSQFPGKKWYLLLDDDTHIFLDNFARYASQPARNARPIYTGKVFYISNCGGFGRTGAPKNDPHAPRGLFAHGGAGIFINALAMEKFYPLVANCIAEYSSCWAGDMQVGLCMRKGGVRVNNFHNGHSHEFQFTPFWPSRAMADSRYTRRLRSQLEPVTFHKIPLPELKLITEFERRCVSKADPVAYSPLREHLTANGIQPIFGKRKTRWDTNVFAQKKADGVGGSDAQRHP